MDSSPCATIVVDEEGSIVVANKEAARLFGYPPEELIGQSIEVLVPTQLRPDHAAHRAQFGAAPDGRPMGRRRDLMAQRRDGTVFPVEVGLNPVHTSQGRLVVSAIVDLSERKRAEERIAQQAELLELANAKLREMASTDSLTALWNRRTFLDQLDIQLQQTVRSGRPLSVLILDVDHFKPYNDQHGHLAGDDVLTAVARVLRASARRSDYVARIGGEEFGVLLPDTDSAGAVMLAERFRLAIESEQWPLRAITASIGAVTVHPDPAELRREAPGRSDVLAAADRALYESKENGRNRVTHAGTL
jgi:diguanylate cyclase (GGDEF)-like protein/PAS domain S-box-containing protein